ncbi:hypothetical protein KIN20_013664 [Parelaphostrongylus tenuis]|uniref:Uncharacterized protein n=1 Tax=Parelaphostrongylus tenuis TaxID=148309 RepID=A0AAD5MDW9_PARTN|nr:hypothetical protein KIN20_013664 [Parelaphostrongylus tenuis]
MNMGEANDGLEKNKLITATNFLHKTFEREERVDVFRTFTFPDVEPPIALIYPESNILSFV